MNMTRKSFVDSFEENENILRKTKTKIFSDGSSEEYLYIFVRLFFIFLLNFKKIFDLKENHQANKILSKQTHERTPRRRRQKFLGL